MADDKKAPPKDTSAKDASAKDTSPRDTGDPKIKRPYATLDLKATEIKVTPIAEKSSQSIAADAARLAASAMAGKPVTAADVPLPAAASTYAEAMSKGMSSATTRTDTAGIKTAPVEQKPQSSSSASAGTDKSATKSPQTTAADAARRPQPTQEEAIVVQKRGGFLSHLAAGLIGGVLALSASEWALPQMGLDGSTSKLADTTQSLERRLQSVEKKTGGGSPDMSAVEQRLAALETTAKQVPYIAEAQSHLVAETKAALASAASDSGAPEYITRLAKVETQLKALSDAGANDPNAGRLEQLAALTGKVADLETSLQTQLTALRKSVSDDVEARITSAKETSEAAKSGTQRIDKDMAAVKSDTVQLTERVASMKLDADRLGEAVRLVREEQSAIKASIDALKAEAAKPADISAAVSPVTDKMATLQKSLDSVVKAEDDRRSNAERILLSLELQNLKRVIDRGHKYAAELADVQKIAGGKVDLAPLEKYKDQGVPAVAELAKDFRATANKAIDIETEPAEGGVVDRLIAGAKSVVRVRKISHDEGDKSAEAVIGRMEMALNEGRLADVLTTAKDLSPKAAEAAQPFLDKVSAKVGVDTAVAALEAQLKSSLNGGTDSAPKATQ